MHSPHLPGLVLLLGLLPAAAGAQNPIGEIYASDASVKGSVQFVSGGMQVMSGSSLTAGDSAALLRLTRGGEVRVCPRTGLSVGSSQNARDLVLGMSRGAVEAHYTLAASADAIVTPDFRLLLAGPGTFHFGIGVDARGSTCVRALAQNTASVVVTELMGDGVYQVKPNESVLFHGGRVSDPGPVVGECGCPAPAPAPVMRAAAEPPPSEIPVIQKKNPPPSLRMPLYGPQPPPQLVPQVRADEVHVEVDAPFVFNAAEPEPPPLEPALRLAAAAAPRLPLVALPPAPKTLAATPAPAPGPQPVAKPEKKKGFMGKVRSFFASIFH